MKVLVTGGAGYIGSITVEELIASGDTVLVFDNLSQGHRAAVHPDADFVHADLADHATVDVVMREFRPDAVMHFASHTLVGESMQKPFLYLQDNVVNGLNLIQSAVDHGVTRFILSSTANLFDNAERDPIEETERIIPGSPYGESKAILERILHWTDRIHGLRYTALRYFNAAGASPTRGEDHDPETHLIPLVLQVALGQREVIRIFGDDYPTHDGTCVRDYVHVRDLAQAHVLAMHALDHGSRTFNLGNGRGYSVRDVIAAAEAVTGCRIATEVAPHRPGDPAVLVASSARIRRELGWSPEFSDLNSILRTAWTWHLAHPFGYSSQV